MVWMLSYFYGFSYQFSRELDTLTNTRVFFDLYCESIWLLLMLLFPDSWDFLYYTLVDVCSPIVQTDQCTSFRLSSTVYLFMPGIGNSSPSKGNILLILLSMVKYYDMYTFGLSLFSRCSENIRPRLFTRCLNLRRTESGFKKNAYLWFFILWP